MNTHLTLQLTIEETNLILEALGQLPYVRVSNLVQNIQSQAQPQLAAIEKNTTPSAIPEQS